MLDLRRHDDAIAEACRRYGVRRLEVFGSAARGDAGPESDVDFIAEFEPPRAQGISDRYFGLLFALEDLLANKVDLLDASALKDPYLLEHIRHERKVLYESSRRQAPV